MVSRRIILCRAMPRSMAALEGESTAMPSYMAASINQKAMVLSPTRAWSCDSAYATHASAARRLVRVCTRLPMSQASSGMASTSIHLSAIAIWRR